MLGLVFRLLASGFRVVGFGFKVLDAQKRQFWWVKNGLPFLTPQTWGILGGLGGSGKVSEGLKKAS